MTMERYENGLAALATGFQEGINSLTDRIEAENQNVKALEDELLRAKVRVKEMWQERSSLAGQLMKVNDMIDSAENDRIERERSKRANELESLTRAPLNSKPSNWAPNA